MLAALVWSVPLNSRCSKKCDAPAISAGSWREPTVTKTPSDAERAPRTTLGDEPAPVCRGARGPRPSRPARAARYLRRRLFLGRRDPSSSENGWLAGPRSPSSASSWASKELLEGRGAHGPCVRRVGRRRAARVSRAPSREPRRARPRRASPRRGSPTSGARRAGPRRPTSRCGAGSLGERERHLALRVDVVDADLERLAEREHVLDGVHALAAGERTRASRCAGGRRGPGGC